MLAYGALVRSRRSWALQYISRAEGVRAHGAHLLSPTTTAELKDGARQALRGRAHDYVQVGVGDDSRPPLVGLEARRGRSTR